MLVISRSLLAAAAGVVPVPVLDDLVASFVRARMLRQLAERRQVDLTRDALAILSDEPQASRLRHFAVTGVTLIALRKAWRKLFVLLAAGRRAEEVAHCFELGMLFDHYCARHHVGPALDAERAAKLRAAFDAVGQKVRREAAVAAARRALARGARPPEGDQALERREDFRLPVRPERENLFQKIARVLDEELAATGGPYLDALVVAFDATWKAG